MIIFVLIPNMGFNFFKEATDYTLKCNWTLDKENFGRLWTCCSRITNELKTRTKLSGLLSFTYFLCPILKEKFLDNRRKIDVCNDIIAPCKFDKNVLGEKTIIFLSLWLKEKTKRQNWRNYELWRRLKTLLQWQ